MTAKEWLSRGWKANGEIDRLEEIKHKTWERCTRATQMFKERVHSTSLKNDPMAEYAALSEEVDRQMDKLIEIKKETLKAILQLDSSLYRQVLIARYINFDTWEAIAVKMNYSRKNILRIHGRALQSIMPIIKDYEGENKYEFTKSS